MTFHNKRAAFPLVQLYLHQAGQAGGWGLC